VVVHQWLKKAVLLSFRLYDSVPMDGGASFPGLGAAPWFDKVPLKTTGWNAARFAKAGFSRRAGLDRAPRLLCGAVGRADAVLVNLGAYVDTGTMVDTWRPSARAPRSARTAISRAASASVACSSLCRPTL